MKFQLALACLLALSDIEDAGAAPALRLELSVDLFASETGYYQIENMDVNRTKYLYPGPSPDVEVDAGNTYIFDQGSGSNWYHPVGFAYVPDGAHGTTWGGEEEPEVEGAADLSYRIDNEVFKCEDVGDTGLDCYEPLFFYPRDVWKDMGKFSAQLTITPAVMEEAAKNGGVLYYFCHIHSKMSGRIIIKDIYDESQETALYPRTYVNVFDGGCGTYGTQAFSRFGGPGNKNCNKRVFVPGTIDSQFEECLDAIDCKQYNEMRTPTPDAHGDMVAVFSQQMISHHQNAVNMAKLSLKHYENDFDTAGLKDILMSIINAQNFQVHQFRNYLGGKLSDDILAEWEGEQCDSKIDLRWVVSRDTSGPPFKFAKGCTTSEFNLCMQINMEASETGYYTIDTYTSKPSPDVYVNEGDSYTFDQSDPSNWYHPVGFAYVPDGAHGTTWGGDEEDEVERGDSLQYLIDDAATNCEKRGETGLGCYEPEFFLPQDVWEGKKYSAKLTITREVADKAADNGGVLYYFCHIHSKMSGRIIIKARYNEGKEKPLYPIVERSNTDTVCGTTGLSDEFTVWNHRFLCGSLSKIFEKCVQSIDYKMNNDMRYFSSEDNDDPVALFCEQMIPHHQNAVNMAKVLMKHHPEEVAAVEDFGGLLMDIVNGQNYQIHQFRAYLKRNPSDRFCKKDFEGKVHGGKDGAPGRNCSGLTPKACKLSYSLRNFCPVTCDMPCQTSCVDSHLYFYPKNNEDMWSCYFVSSMVGEKQRRKICAEKEEVAYMCPESCGLCNKYM